MTATESEPLDARVAGALRRAGELEASDWAGAIDVLAEANRAAPSAELERALVALRHRCATRVTASDPGARLAGGAVAPVGASGLPETDLAALDARSLRAALLGHGSLLVRGAITREDATEIADAIDRCWAVSTSEEPPAPADAAIWEPFWPADGDGGGEQWVRGIRNWVRAAGGVLLCDSPEIQFRILDLYRQIGLQTVVTDYLGGRPVLSANKCTLRRVSPETIGGWHQDGAFLGAGVRAVNLWLALTDCGTDAPGMDLVARRLDGVVQTGGPGAYFDWAASDAVVEEAAGPGGIVRPEFRAGDLLIFDELMLHRTAAEPSMARDRRAIELWSFSADAYPDGHIRLVW